MISLQEVVVIHSILIEKFGGIQGIRDMAALESAINRPNQTFEGKELYPTILEKVAALLESIIKNHPFNDGNKRIGYTISRLMLLDNNLDLRASQNDKYNFIIQIAENKVTYEHILEWLKMHSR
jgi:death-on-curing protein